MTFRLEDHNRVIVNSPLGDRGIELIRMTEMRLGSESIVVAEYLHVWCGAVITTKNGPWDTKRDRCRKCGRI